MQLKHSVFLTFIAVKCLRISDGKFCFWSNKTVDSVTSCPRTKSEMMERARLKNCTSLAFIQNCTETVKFKYHCVMNELEDEFLEVCAPEYYIHDACTEYNTYGAVIQPHYRLKCSEVDPPCPGRYLSTDAYLYEGCYDAVKKNKDRILTGTWVISNGSVIINGSRIPERIAGSEDNNFYMLIFLVLVLVSEAVIIFVRRQPKTHLPCCNEYEVEDHTTALELMGDLPITERNAQIIEWIG